MGYEWRGFWIAAIRETFEESGLLLAYDQQGEIISFKEAESERRFSSYRQPLHDGQISLLMFVKPRGLISCRPDPFLQSVRHAGW